MTTVQRVVISLLDFINTMSQVIDCKVYDEEMKYRTLFGYIIRLREQV